MPGLLAGIGFGRKRLAELSDLPVLGPELGRAVPAETSSEVHRAGIVSRLISCALIHPAALRVIQREQSIGCHW